MRVVAYFDDGKESEVKFDEPYSYKVVEAALEILKDSIDNHLDPRPFMVKAKERFAAKG